MDFLEKIIKVTQAQYDTLASGGTVGEYTGLSPSYLYLILNDDEVTNIVDGQGSGSVQMVQDGDTGTFDFTGKNGNATSADSTLTGQITYGATGNFATALGGISQASGKRSLALGDSCVAKGLNSVAMGQNSVALGDNSFAQGRDTTANGTGAVAMGFQTQAKGAYSLAIGNNNITNGNFSFALGQFCNTYGVGSVALGIGNDAKNDGEYVVGTCALRHEDSLFRVGNGTSDTVRSNAFEVKKDGTAWATAPTTYKNDSQDKCLVNKGWALSFMKQYSMPETYLVWGGDRYSAASTTPIGTVLCDELRANRLAFINGEALTFEYSSDGGTTWTDYGESNIYKSRFCTLDRDIPVGRPDKTTEVEVDKSKTRITLTSVRKDGKLQYLYTKPVKMLVQVSTATPLEMVIETRTGTDFQNDGSWKTFGTYMVAGWSGWNEIPFVLDAFGGSGVPSHIWQLRLTFTVKTKLTSYPKQASLLSLRLYGITHWDTPSDLARQDHLYSYDEYQNATFPARLNAKQLREGGQAISDLYQAKDADLTAIAGLSGTGFLQRTGDNTWKLVADTTTGLTSLINGSGTNAAQMVQDGTSGTFDFTGKNANATALDSSLTGQIAYGATGAFSTVLGGKAQASGKRSFAHGTTTVAKGAYSHAEGDNSVALGADSHAEGGATTAKGNKSHAEGSNTIAKGDNSHAEGEFTNANSYASHAEGHKTTVLDKLAVPTGGGSTPGGGGTASEKTPDDTLGGYAHAEGENTQVLGYAGHSEGLGTRAWGHFSHAEGANTVAGKLVANGSVYKVSGEASHAEGKSTVASGEVSHATGISTTASGQASTTMGYNTVASGENSLAIGSSTKAIGMNSFAAGGNSSVSGDHSGAIGSGITVSGSSSFACGDSTYALGSSSFSANQSNKSNNAYTATFGFQNETNADYQFLCGYRANPNSNTLFAVGNGSDYSIKTNAFEVQKNGTIVAAGDLWFNGKIKGTTEIENYLAPNLLERFVYFKAHSVAQKDIILQLEAYHDTFNKGASINVGVQAGPTPTSSLYYKDVNDKRYNILHEGNVNELAHLYRHTIEISNDTASIVFQANLANNVVIDSVQDLTTALASTQLSASGYIGANIVSKITIGADASAITIKTNGGNKTLTDITGFVVTDSVKI